MILEELSTVEYIIAAIACVGIPAVIGYMLWRIREMRK
jgi:hypothetical protein